MKKLLTLTAAALVGLAFSVGAAEVTRSDEVRVNPDVQRSATTAKKKVKRTAKKAKKKTKRAANRTRSAAERAADRTENAAERARNNVTR